MQNGLAKKTTLCYIEKDGCYLMMHRTKKSFDENKDKWIGVGGKFLFGESPFDCVKREVFEETSLQNLTYKYRGIVTFVSDVFGTEYMHLFTATGVKNNVDFNCKEGELCWVNKDEVLSLNLWQGDKIFLDLLTKNVGFFSLKLVYQGDNLISHVIDF